MNDLRKFGKIFNSHPLNFSTVELRSFLSIYGVIIFTSNQVSHKEQEEVMSRIGTVQNVVQQQAPRSYADKHDPNVILLHNEDFLGQSRMGWHTDQTYLKTDHLPIRSLYCTEVNAHNVTEFADVAFLTDEIIKKFSLPLDTMARYYIDSAKTKFSERCVFADCSHIGKKLFRYDNRMEFLHRLDSIEFKDFCRNILNGTQIPKVSVIWKPWDFVIFDNNRCPHRRSVMNGECKLSRLTCDFWTS